MRSEFLGSRGRQRRGRHRAGGALGARFYALWAGQTISQLGDYIAYFTIPAFVRYVITDRPLDFGLIYAAESFPTFLVGVFAGVLIDRMRLRPLMIVADLVRAGAFVVLARIAAGSSPGVASVLTISFLVGTFAATFTSALFSFLPVIVRPDALGTANSRVALSQQIAFVVGPALGGAIVGIWDYTTAFTINAATFLASAISIAVLGRVSREPQTDGAGYWAEAREGFSYLWREPHLRLLTATGALSNFVVGFLEATIVLIGADVFGITETDELSLLFVAAGAGGVLGALSAGKMSSMLGLGKTLIAGMFVFGGGFTLWTYLGSGWQVLALITLTLVGLTWINVPLITMRQLYTPDRLLGRVTSASRAIMWSTLPLGSLVGTWIAGLAGITTVARLEPLLIIAFAVYLIWTPLWRATPERAAQERAAFDARGLA